jgi:N-acetylglucosaminyl-diphospho-decaprenol L-rhamnosyltransferase
VNVTVVIATRDRRPQLLRTLPHHRAPVIVVDNGSSDGTADAVSLRFPAASVVRLDDNLGAAARNVGAALATTRYVAFADDDSYWDGDSLEQAATLLDAYPRAALLTARVQVGPERRPDPVSEAMSGGVLGFPDDLPGPSVLGFLACAAIVRRDAFLAVGGFNARLGTYGEEALLAMDLAAAGWGLAFVPSLVVRHLPTGGRAGDFARRRRQARNDLLTAWLRRPLPVGLRAAGHSLGSAHERAGLRDALAQLPWVLRNRHVLPPGVEDGLRRLERQPFASPYASVSQART